LRKIHIVRENQRRSKGTVQRRSPISRILLFTILPLERHGVEREGGGRGEKERFLLVVGILIRGLLGVILVVFS
jgi:hypothetical protein